MILVSMERGDPTPYYGSKQLWISYSQGVVTNPSQEDMLQKKGSGRYKNEQYLVYYRIRYYTSPRVFPHAGIHISVCISACGNTRKMV